MNFSLLFDDAVEYATRADRYRERFARLEHLAGRRGIDLESLDLAGAERLWKEAGGDRGGHGTVL
ncbi:MAG: hypothetical protein ACRDN9_08700 [Streptosporangiaceae bacterium]